MRGFPLVLAALVFGGADAPGAAPVPYPSTGVRVGPAAAPRLFVPDTLLPPKTARRRARKAAAARSRA